jgi:hypothetical protein
MMVIVPPMFVRLAEHGSIGIPVRRVLFVAPPDCNAIEEKRKTPMLLAVGSPELQRFSRFGNEDCRF